MEELADFDTFFKEYYVALYSYVHSIINNWEASRDIASDAFEYIWKNYGRIEKTTAKSYLFIYVRNRAIDYLRHQEIRSLYAEMTFKLDEQFTETEYQEQDYRMHKVRQVMDCLTPYTRHILEECYLNEKKYKDVAQELHISVSAVRKHIVKALKLIREACVKEK